MRSGFYGRVGFLLGSVSVSHGFGGFGNEIISFEPEPLPPPGVLFGKQGPGTRGALAAPPARLGKPLDCPPKRRVPRAVRPGLRGTSPGVPLAFKSLDETPARAEPPRGPRPHIRGAGARRGPRVRTEKKKADSLT